jgi:hypothetical protein
MIISFTSFAMVANLQWFSMWYAEEKVFKFEGPFSVRYEQGQKKELIVENMNITHMAARQ